MPQIKRIILLLPLLQCLIYLGIRSQIYAQELTILYSNNVNGEIEPCG